MFAWQRRFALIPWLSVVAYLLALIHHTDALNGFVTTVIGTSLPAENVQPVQTSASGLTSPGSAIESDDQMEVGTIWRSFVLTLAQLARQNFPDLFPPEEGHEDCLLCLVAKMTLAPISFDNSSVPPLLPVGTSLHEPQQFFVPPVSCPPLRPPRVSC